MTSAEREELKSALAQEPLRTLVEESSQHTRDLLLGYLRQEGWGDGEEFALVDVGWRGSMAGALSKTLENESIPQPDLYLFFGLADDAHRVAGELARDRMDAWFFDDACKHGYLPYLPSTTSLIEMFCAADHGAVVGYRRDGDRIGPVLRTPESPMKAWGLPHIHEITAAYVAAFTTSLQTELCDPYMDVRRGLREVLRLFWLEPSSAEAKYWGKFPVEVNLNNISCPRTRRPHDGARGCSIFTNWPTGAAPATQLAQSNSIGKLMAIPHCIFSPERPQVESASLPSAAHMVESPSRKRHNPSYLWPWSASDDQITSLHDIKIH